MTDEAAQSADNMTLLRLSTDIVSAYVRNNSVPSAQLQEVIREVYVSLQAVQNEDIEASKPLKPAVPIKRSITPDYIVCLEDGRKLKMLKRHLRTAYGMTPEDYRAKWGLDSSYPMVAPNYAKRRSEFAKSIGLGQKQSAARRRSTPKRGAK